MVAELNRGSNDASVGYRWVSGAQAIGLNVLRIEHQVLTNRTPDSATSSTSSLFDNIDTILT